MSSCIKRHLLKGLICLVLKVMSLKMLSVEGSETSNKNSVLFE